MIQNEVLTDALQRSASIHQPHALKAYLAMKYLSVRFENFGVQEWKQCQNLIAISEVKVPMIMSENIESKVLSDDRIQYVMQNGVLPIGYIAMKQWHQRAGIDHIFNHYLNLAAERNEYLSHNVSILLALREVYSELEDDQIPFFLDRFAEYLSSTFRKITKGETTSIINSTVEVDKVLDSCIEQPGFFGHNLITLCWLLRSRTKIGKDIFYRILVHVYEQSKWDFDDPEDKIDHLFLQGCNSVSTENEFENIISSLINDQNKNIHQITLADSLVYLWSLYPDKRENISMLAVYYSTKRN
ncbi:hypothetical protein [Ferrimonas senticii]|uniref:hypothetical protein n=1 Tax=Ferrimonas senticii TaxID=394566 RepID=UPI000405C434|nr:hypothetical protein [Ferrimonas senticii]